MLNANFWRYFLNILPNNSKSILKLQTKKKKWRKDHEMEINSVCFALNTFHATNCMQTQSINQSINQYFNTRNRLCLYLYQKGKKKQRYHTLCSINDCYNEVPLFPTPACLWNWACSLIWLGWKWGWWGECSSFFGSCLIIPVLSESVSPSRWLLQQHYRPPQMIPGEEGKLRNKREKELGYIY